MDLLAEVQGAGGGGGGSRSRDAELAKVMFEGTQQYRKKLKFPEWNVPPRKSPPTLRTSLCPPPDALLLDLVGQADAERIKADAEDTSFFAFYDEDEVGRFFFLRFLADAHPAHGNALLLCGRYKYTVHQKRSVAQVPASHRPRSPHCCFPGEQRSRWHSCASVELADGSPPGPRTCSRRTCAIRSCRR